MSELPKLQPMMKPEDVARELGCTVDEAKLAAERAQAAVWIGRRMWRLRRERLADVAAHLGHATAKRTKAPGFRIAKESPPICGVYLLIKGGEVVYVGQSVDVETRLRTHWKDGVKQYDYATYYECHRLNLDVIEHLLIDALAPRLNRNRGRVLHRAMTVEVMAKNVGLDTARGVEALVRWLVSP